FFIQCSARRYENIDKLCKVIVELCTGKKISAHSSPHTPPSHTPSLSPSHTPTPSPPTAHISTSPPSSHMSSSPSSPSPIPFYTSPVLPYSSSLTKLQQGKGSFHFDINSHNITRSCYIHEEFAIGRLRGRYLAFWL